MRFPHWVCVLWLYSQTIAAHQHLHDIERWNLQNYGLATLNWPRFFPSPRNHQRNMACIVMCRGGHSALIFFPSPILLPILMGYQAICFWYQTELYINNMQISGTVWTLLHILSERISDSERKLVSSVWPERKCETFTNNVAQFSQGWIQDFLIGAPTPKRATLYFVLPNVKLLLDEMVLIWLLPRR